jgi:hypothetical protein
VNRITVIPAKAGMTKILFAGTAQLDSPSHVNKQAIRKISVSDA